MIATSLHAAADRLPLPGSEGSEEEVVSVHRHYVGGRRVRLRRKSAPVLAMDSSGPRPCFSKSCLICAL